MEQPKNDPTRRFAIVLKNPENETVVELTDEPKRFGRIPAYVDVCLRDRAVAKMLFDIQWNAQQQRHEIQVLGAYWPPALNGTALGSEACQLLAPGDTIEIGPFSMKYIDVSAGCEGDHRFPRTK